MAEKTRSNWHPASILAKIKKFFLDQKSEIKKIVWPSKKQVINNTGIVIGVVVIFSVIIGSFDWALSAVIKVLFG
ncbi:MAG: preprotein translocase subunit SecE [Oscillospiraceae bacterium]